MGYRPHPNRERALRQLARKERVTAHRFTTPAGQIAEDYDFPGQSFQALWRAAQPSGREAGKRMWAAFSTLPTVEECEAAGEYALEHGVGTTVFGVDEYRLSTRPGVVGGGS